MKQYFMHALMAAFAGREAQPSFHSALRIGHKTYGNYHKPRRYKRAMKAKAHFNRTGRPL